MQTETHSHPVHMCGVRDDQSGVLPTQRKQNFKGPRETGIWPTQTTGKWPPGLVQEERRGVPEAGGQQAAEAWGSCKMLVWFLLRTMEATKEVSFDFS